ncbi:MAG: alanine racemase [Candidatus Gastranaerophilales bacterium]|nr:alanine racemase [Candidatus Gastranaerophilales bacterium]
MSKLRQPYLQTRRDAWVEVNLGAIEHNISAMLRLCNEKTKFLAVVKADAYGHGSTMAAPTLLASGVDVLGVASVDEGIELRNSGVSAPILVLGTAPSWSVASAVENDLELSIFTQEHLTACVNTFEHLKIKPKVHIKIDTGMHRIGLTYKEASSFINKVISTKEVELRSIFSHLACAEDEIISEMQFSNFEPIREEFPFIPAHILNSAGIMSYQGKQFDMVRSGIAIYGLMPDLSSNVNSVPSLKPAMSLKARIVHLKEIESDLGVSYGYSYKTDHNPTKIATIPVGYADGVSRALSNKIYGLINGKKVKQIGNITMDQMMFDVSDVENVHIGDVVTLIGTDGVNTIFIDEWAKLLNTINYELTCRLKARLPRVYSR